MSATIAPFTLEAINIALQNHNPFSQPPFVNANYVWGKSFPDVETLNAHASDAVFRALDEIRSGHYSTTSILITAQDGTGKSHIISRIRHRLQIQGGALFVFASKFDNLNQVKQGFQQILADSLSNIGSKGVKQWQELATAMANQAMQVATPNPQILAPNDLVKKFEDADPEKIIKLVDQLTRAFCKARNVRDPDIVRAIFWTLSEEEAPYAFNWLGGNELAQFKANELRLPNQRQSFDAVLQILALISEYNELVICFDNLDALEFDDPGYHKSQVVATLVKELLENLRRGVVLSVMMPGTWAEKVKKDLPRGIWSKMTAQGEPYDLKYIDSDSVVELASCFLKEYYEERKLIPPYPVYPFDERELREIGKGKPTVREVLQWCRDNCKITDEINGRNSLTLLQEDAVEQAFNAESSENLGSYLDNNNLIADALFFGFQSLIKTGQLVEDVILKDVTTGVKKRGGKDDYLNFKILCKDQDKDVCIGVAVLQYEGGQALGAGFRRLLDTNTFGLSRGCLVRSKNKLVNSHFQKKYLAPLIQKGGEFVDLQEEQIKPLLAIRSVYQKRSSDYKVTEEQIFDFIARKGLKNKLGVHNELLKEILSSPSYQVPVVAAEPEVTNNPVNNSSSDDLDLAEELTNHE